MAVDKKLVGQAIRQIRKRRGLTQAQLAKAAGLSSGGNSVALIERGSRGVSLDSLESLAKALELPSGCLLMLGRRMRRNEPFHDLVTSTQKLILKLVELHSVLKAEEAAGTFKPTGGKKRTTTKKAPGTARKSARKAAKEASAA